MTAGTAGRRFRCEPEIGEEESEDETDCAFGRHVAGGFRLRDDAPAAADANVPGRIAGAGDATLSIASATASAADGLSGRHHGPGGRHLSDAAAAAADGSAAAARRTRLRLHRRTAFSSAQKR
jgi:hypothetical protein